MKLRMIILLALAAFFLSGAQAEVLTAKLPREVVETAIGPGPVGRPPGGPRGRVPGGTGNHPTDHKPGPQRTGGPNDKPGVPQHERTPYYERPVDGVSPAMTADEDRLLRVVLKRPEISHYLEENADYIYFMLSKAAGKQKYDVIEEMFMITLYDDPDANRVLKGIQGRQRTIDAAANTLKTVIKPLRVRAAPAKNYVVGFPKQTAVIPSKPTARSGAGNGRFGGGGRGNGGDGASQNNNDSSGNRKEYHETRTGGGGGDGGNGSDGARVFDGAYGIAPNGPNKGYATLPRKGSSEGDIVYLVNDVCPFSWPDPYQTVDPATVGRQRIVQGNFIGSKFVVSRVSAELHEMLQETARLTQSLQVQIACYDGFAIQVVDSPRRVIVGKPTPVMAATGRYWESSLDAPPPPPIPTAIQFQAEEFELIPVH